jgi:nucleotide-binding universal stress UspA family protein
MGSAVIRGGGFARAQELRRADGAAEWPAWAGVVVGVDDSVGVLSAVAWAGAEAARRGVGLHLVQVLPASGASETDAEAVRARALLHRAMGAVGTAVPDVAVSIATVEGHVGPALVSYAAAAPLLVVGSHGRSIPLSAGRAVSHITAHARCPVVVVPPKWAGAWPSTPSPRPVVVGVDGSDEGERALVFAAESAHRLGVDLIALTAGDRGRVMQADGSRRGLIGAHLADCRARRPGLSIGTRLVGDKPAEALLDAARQAQLVVVGSRGCGAAANALLGSTSQALLRDGPCAVAVLSPHTVLPPAPPSEVAPAAGIALGAQADRVTRTRSTAVPS